MSKFELNKSKMFLLPSKDIKRTTISLPAPMHAALEKLVVGRYASVPDLVADVLEQFLVQMVTDEEIPPPSDELAETSGKANAS